MEKKKYNKNLSFSLWAFLVSNGPRCGLIKN